MNSIRKPRKRPRVTSFNFRVLGWILVREAAIRVLHPAALGAAWESKARDYLVRHDTDEIARTVGEVLGTRPDRREYGPAAAHPGPVIDPPRA